MTWIQRRKGNWKRKRGEFFWRSVRQKGRKVEQTWQIWDLQRQRGNTFRSSCVPSPRGQEGKCQQTHAGTHTHASLGFAMVGWGRGAGGHRMPKGLCNSKHQRQISRGSAWASHAQRGSWALRTNSSVLLFINSTLPRFLCPDVTVILKPRVTVNVCAAWDAETLNAHLVGLNLCQSSPAEHSYPSKSTNTDNKWKCH